MEHVVTKIQSMLERKEICGLVYELADGCLDIKPIKNISKDLDTFIMDKFQYCDAMNELKDKVVAIYHTHPIGSSRPSAKDVEYYKRSNYGMLIVSPKEFTYYAKNN